MLLHDDILVVGDSFCADRLNPEKHWPYLLKELLMQDSNFDPRPTRGFGLSGVAWWSTRNRLLTELQIHPPKILVIVHTESTRIPSDLDFPLNAGSAGYEHKQLMYSMKHNPERHMFTPEVVQASKDYFKYLCSVHYHEWAAKQWYDELDDVINHYKLERVIHLLAFGSLNSDKNHVFKTGTTSTEILWNLSDDNNDNWKNNSAFSKEHYNHFNSANNIKIAHSLYRALIDYKTGPQNLNLLG